MADSSSAIARSVIYREYVFKHFQTTVISEYNPFDFILGFASEDYNPSGGGTGNFHPTWNLVTFSPENVKKLKEKYPEVRVVISIGGVGTDYPFNPAEEHVWIATAVRSIKEIIHLYDGNNHKNLIDGIDIHYDSIKSSAREFSKCIGQVIKSLKEDPLLSIKVVSIAPRQDTQSHCEILYHENRNYIDFVDYLFTEQTYSSIQEVKDAYEKVVAEYRPATVLPGYLNPPVHDKIPKDAIIYLIKNKLAPGFFTYSSHNSPNPGLVTFPEDAPKHI